MKRRRLTRPQLQELRTLLSERDLRLLSQIETLRLMSGQQIEAVHFPPESHATPATASRLCRRVLARLAAHQLLTRLPRQIGGVRAGSHGFVYGLGPVGHRLLHDDGSRLRVHEPGLAYIDHQLAASQLVVELTLAARAGGVETVTVEGEPACWRSIPAVGRSVLRPDLFLALGVRELQYDWFVEIDRDTHRGPALLTKARLYERYYQSGVEQAVRGTFPRVIWVTPTAGRAKQLTQLFARPEFTSGMMVVTTATDAVKELSGGQS